MTLTLFVCVSAMALLSRSSSEGSDEAPSDDRVQNEADIRSAIARQVEAWNQGNAKAFAETFQEDGSFTNLMGITSFTRQEFEQRHLELFLTIFKGSNLKQIVRRIKFLRPDVALADIETEFEGYSKLPPGVRAERDGILRTRLQIVFVKEQGLWQIAAYHNVDLKPLPPR